MVKNMKNQLKTIEHIFLFIVLVTFFIVAGKYSYPFITEHYAIYKENFRQHNIEKKRQAYACPSGTVTISVEGGKVCRPDDMPESVYKKIFDTYSYKSNGKEQIYSFLSEGDIASANEILENNFPIERYGITKVSDSITWTEDPIGDRYWRFLFYGFRWMTNLFFAFDTTNDPRYLQKAAQVTESFIDRGMDKLHSWDDFHGVSFRTMFIVKTWWMLRENNMLTYDVNEKILKSLEIHGNFLADPNHYEKGNNHVLNEAAALYLLALNFPDLPHAEEWLVLSEQRLSDGLVEIVDKDGVLVENSPYYHFYTLEKYWEIHNYSQKQENPITDIFNERLQKMISHAAYILQPNREIPLLGASLKRKIAYSGIYKDIAQSSPELQYVLTGGKEGKEPSKLNVVYLESGQIILRSGWKKDKDFENQTQVIFDAGPYRTDHSDLNALSFSLYSNGIALMPDAGLYTYDENDYKKYFYGTASHNTVTVDDLDQINGTAISGAFVETKDYVAQSAVSELYKGVIHKRVAVLVGKKYLLVIDKLISDKEHDYKQLFHLFPGAKINISGTSVQVLNPTKKSDEEVMNIFQLAPENISLDAIIGQTSPPRGLCSQEYTKALPCYSIEYAQKSQNAEYITLIELGKHDNHLRYSYDGNSIKIQDSSKIVNISLSDVDGTPSKVVVHGSNPGKASKSQVDILNPLKWIISEKNKQFGQIEGGVDSINFETNTSGKTFYTDLPTALDLSNKNLLIKMRVNDRQNVNKLDILLSTNNWKGYVTNDLKNSYRKEYDGEWLTISLGKGLKRTTGGQWRQYGAGFDWSKIDSIRIAIGTEARTTAEVQLSEIATTPENEEGEVVIIFDDGYESILPAIEEMNKYGFKGNIAVIADRVTGNKLGYLSLKQLKKIKDVDGWDIINHSKHHVDAVQTYAKSKDLDGFTEDLLAGAKFLIENDLNTTPNWYIYPHGATNKAIKDIVGKYYAFARTTINAPEAYPFGEPLGVKTISADGAESTGVKKFVPVEDLEGAVLDAKIYKLPLFITFHRIHSRDSDKPGYELSEFNKLLKFISDSHIKVKTLREFDADHNIAERSLSFFPSTPPQIAFAINVQNVSLFKKMNHFLQDVWSFLVDFVNNFEQLITGLSARDTRVLTLSELDEINGVPQNKWSIKDKIPEQIALQVHVAKKSFVQKIYESVKMLFNTSVAKFKRNVDYNNDSNIISSDTTFNDNFNKKEIIEEVGDMSKSTSPYWWINSGAYMYLKDGLGMTIQGELPTDDLRRIDYAKYKSDTTDNGYHPQNIFRLVTRSKWQSFRQEIYFNIAKINLSQTNDRNAWSGVLLFNRYQDGNNLYYTGIRVDGHAIIKKKIRGVYYTMAEKTFYSGTPYNRDTNPNLIPEKTWIGLRSEVKTNANGTVSIKVFIDKDKTGTWVLVAEATDDGKSYGGVPILNEGYAGLRTDFMDVKFDDYRIIKQ